MSMHRLIMCATADQQIDHRNGQGCDNRRCNLRFSTQSQNCMNRNKIIGCTSKYKGVSWSKGMKKWRACIYPNYTFRHLGWFRDEHDAALAYNEAALEHYAEFARLNVIVEKGAEE